MWLACIRISIPNMVVIFVDWEIAKLTRTNSNPKLQTAKKRKHQRRNAVLGGMGYRFTQKLCSMWSFTPVSDYSWKTSLSCHKEPSESVHCSLSIKKLLGNCCHVLIETLTGNPVFPISTNLNATRDMLSRSSGFRPQILLNLLHLIRSTYGMFVTCASIGIASS